MHVYRIVHQSIIIRILHVARKRLKNLFKTFLKVVVNLKLNLVDLPVAVFDHSWPLTELSMLLLTNEM